MSVPLEPLERAVAGQSMRLAVFDVALRQQTGQWQLDRRIELGTAIDRFARRDSFLDEAGRVRLPLHDPDEPALTPEFLLVDRDAEPPMVTFYDLGERSRRAMSVRDIESTFPAWRARFWTEGYQPGDTMPLVQEFGTPDDDPTAIDAIDPTPDRPPPDTIIDAARAELSARRTAERRRRRTAFERLPVTEFIDTHGGIQGAVAGGREIDDFGQQTAIAELPADHELAGDPDLSMRTGIHPGDVVAVTAEATAGFPVEAEVFAVEEDRIDLGIYWDTADEPGAEAAFDAESGPHLSIGTLVDGSRYAAIEAALGTVERTDHARSRYAGRASLTFDRAGEPVDPDVDLNRDQRAAVDRVRAADAMAVVRTPPGTGARRVLWSIVRETVENGGRVCLLGPDGDAVDRLLEGAGEPPIADRAADVGFDLHRCQPDEPPPVGVDIVAAPITLANFLDDHEYDLAVLDQAARVSVPGGAVPFAKAGRVLLVGDPMQSPPSQATGRIDEAIAPSIQDHVVAAYGPDVVVQLRCQYRMNQAIALFPNRVFYEDDLIHGQRNREWVFDTVDPLVAYPVADEERKTPSGSAYNDEAVRVAIDEVDKLLDRGVSADEIGILTPSSAETGKLRAALGEYDEAAASAIAVGGLDRFRCDGREAMIVSFVRGGQEVGPFWTDPGINVALTRASKRIALLGAWDAIANDMAGRTAGQLATYLAERGLIEERP